MRMVLLCTLLLLAGCQQSLADMVKRRDALDAELKACFAEVRMVRDLRDVAAVKGDDLGVALANERADQLKWKIDDLASVKLSLDAKIEKRLGK